MSNSTNELIINIDKLHTTELGIARISKNLGLSNVSIVDWCRARIVSKASIISKKGKNWYITVDNCVITVNAFSYTLITAHKII